MGFVLCAPCVLCGEATAQDFKTVHPGVEFAHVEHKLGGDPVKISLLRLDLKKVRLDVHHAFDKAIGVEPTSTIAKNKGAVAAINAGFFRLDKSEFAGDAAGVLRIDRKLLSESEQPFPAVALFNGPRRTNISFGGLTQQRIIKINGSPLLPGTNRERKANDLVEYTTEFGSTTPPKGECVEATVQRGRIVKVVDSCGSAIPVDGYVISATGEKAALLKRSAVSRAKVKASISTVLDDARATRDFEGAEDVISGRGYLLRNGQIIGGFGGANKSFAETRHPRTAVAKLKDGRFLMMTVDGRQPGVSVGMNLPELAEYLLSLGAVEAINLDGGGSTTMYFDGKVVNTPSDKEGERKVSDAIVVTLRNRRK